MKSHKLVRLAAVAVLTMAAATGAVASATPAGAAVAVRQCGSYTLLYDYGTVVVPGAAYIYVDDAEQCNTAPFSITYPVYIYEYTLTWWGQVVWQTVASGSGSLEFRCTDLQFYSTSVTMAEGKQGFYCP